MTLLCRSRRASSSRISTSSNAGRKPGAASEISGNHRSAERKARALYNEPKMAGSRDPQSVAASNNLPWLSSPQQHGALAALTADERDLRISDLAAAGAVVAMLAVA